VGDASDVGVTQEARHELQRPQNTVQDSPSLNDDANAEAELRALQCSRDRQKQGCF
jgi:hypothetical protein